MSVPAAHGCWDLAARELPAVLRASVHVYNDDADVDALVEAVREVARERSKQAQHAGAGRAGSLRPPGDPGPATGPEVYDAVVLGLGVHGRAAAHELARRGLRVVGLERFRAGARAGLVARRDPDDPAGVPGPGVGHARRRRLRGLGTPRKRVGHAAGADHRRPLRPPPLVAARRWPSQGGTFLLSKGELDELLDAFGINLDRHSTAYRKVGAAVLKHFVRALQAIDKRNEGEVIETPRIIEPTNSEPATGTTLSAALGGWRKAKQPAPTTANEFEHATRRFVEPSY